MYHSPSQILATLLVQAGKAVFDQNLATPLKWTVFTVVVPDAPNRLITIYDTMGIKDGRIMDTGETIVHPGWQIMTRSASPQTGFRIARMLFDYTDIVVNASVPIAAQTIEDMLIPAATYRVVGLFKSSPIMSAGQDEKRRFLFTLNGTTTITQL